MEIRKAKIKDSPQILKLTDAAHIKNLKNLDGGFLMIPDASLELYEKWISGSPYCYVADSGSGIAGALIVLPAHLLPKTNQLNAYFAGKYLGEDFLYVAEVVVDAVFRGKGIGRRMYETFFADADEHRLIFSSSMKKPYNKASEQFHLKVGFEKIEIFLWPNGDESFLYRYRRISR